MMERLYPIIRRARRPLVIKDDDSQQVPPSPPLPALAEQGPVNYAERGLSAEKGKRAIASASKRKE